MVTKYSGIFYLIFVDFFSQFKYPLHFITSIHMFMVYENKGSLGIEPTRICTQFLKIGFLVGGVFIPIISTEEINQIKKGKL